MPPLPEIPAQDFFLGLASAGILVWTLLVASRSRLVNGSLSMPSVEDVEGGLFSSLPKERQTGQFAFLGSLFLHILAVAMLPWVEKLAPGELPFRLRGYDFVIVQFKPTDGPLQVPSNLAELIPPPPPPTPTAPPENAMESDVDDAGRGNRIAAPRLDKPAGGEAAEPEPSLRARLEIEFPKPTPPAERALAAPEAAPTITAAAAADLSWQFAALEAPDIPKPGLPAPEQDVVNERAELAFDPGDTVEILRGGRSSGAGRSLVEVVGNEGAGGADPLNRAQGAGGPGIEDLLAEAFGDGTLGELLASRGAGTGRGSGMGDRYGPGVEGLFGGPGYGSGYRGQGPVPRKLHGIIMIADDPALPEAEGVLTGNPVYTVYVEVPGSRRKWILQVCADEDDGSGIEFAGDSGVIRILSRKSLDPPFAFRRFGPEIEYSALTEHNSPPRIVIYAKVDEEGALAGLRVVSGLDPETDNRVLASLESWEFHPAYRDGRPVAVEALFGIPLR